MLTWIIAAIIVIYLLYVLGIPDKIRLAVLGAKVEGYCRKIDGLLQDKHCELQHAQAKWDHAASDKPLSYDQEVAKSAQLNSIWDNMRYIEEVRTRNARCKDTLDQMTKRYPAMDFSLPENKLMLDLVARDVDIQGWSVDGICGGTTTRWW